MSNIQEVLKNKITKENLLRSDIEARLIYAFKNPEVELPEFLETQENNPKILEALARKIISRALGFNQVNKEIFPSQDLNLKSLQTLRELQINSKNPNDLKIEGLSVKIFNELKKRKLSRAFGELDHQEKKKIIQENWNENQIEDFIKNKIKDIYKKYFNEELEEEFKEKLNNVINNSNSDEFIQKQIQILIENLSSAIDHLNEEQKNDLLSFSDQKLLALSKIENLNSVIFCLNDKGLTLELVKLDNEKLLALSKIYNLDSVISCLNVKGLTLELFKLDNDKIEALSKIENLNSVIFCLNDKGLTPKFLGLPIETLQDPKLIKQAFGINFEIEMKKPAKTEPVQTMEFSDFSSPRSSPNI